jgi:hypothetical protein
MGRGRRGGGGARRVKIVELFLFSLFIFNFSLGYVFLVCFKNCDVVLFLIGLGNTLGI